MRPQISVSSATVTPAMLVELALYAPLAWTVFWLGVVGAIVEGDL